MGSLYGRAGRGGVTGIGFMLLNDFIFGYLTCWGYFSLPK